MILYCRRRILKARLCIGSSGSPRCGEACKPRSTLSSLGDTIEGQLLPGHESFHAIDECPALEFESGCDFVVGKEEVGRVDID